MALTEDGKAWLRAAVKRIDIPKMVGLIHSGVSIKAGMARPRHEEDLAAMQEAMGVSTPLPYPEGETVDMECATCGLEVVLGPNVASKHPDVVFCPICAVVFSQVANAPPVVAEPGIGVEVERGH